MLFALPPLADVCSSFVVAELSVLDWPLAALATGALATVFAWLWLRGRRVEGSLANAGQAPRTGELPASISQPGNDAQLAQAIFAASPDAVLVLDPHNEREPMAIVACGDKVCAWHGWTREELVGRSVNKIERDPTRWTVATALACTERLRAAGTVCGEAEHRRRDGTFFPVEFTNSLLVLGGREYVLGFDRDITARRRAEAALRASEERFRLIFDASPAGMQLQDPNDREVPLRIVDANRHAAEMHGITVGDMIGRSIGDFDVMPVDYEIAQARLRRLRAAPSATGECVHRHVDGREFPIEFVSALVVLDGREFILGIDRNISERKRIDAELNESRRLRAVGAMVGGIAHEFNNLLTPMLLHAEMLGYENPDNLRMTAHIEPICIGINRAGELTQRILTFGRRSVEFREVLNLEKVVRDNIDLFARTIDRRIQVVVQPPAESLVVWANHSDLNQLVINLVLNARDTLLEKMGESRPMNWTPRIAIFLKTIARPSGARHEPDRQTVRRWHQLTVRDNGLGMSAEVRERVFEPFFTTKSVGRGTGLGLATAWHVSSTLGGWIELDSRPGEGTEFHVFIPTAPDGEVASLGSGGGAQVSVMAAVNRAPAAPEPAKRLRVLLVEDSEIVALATKQMIEGLQHEVNLVLDGQEAWAELARNYERYDVVFTDLNLPGMTGVELVRRLRELPFKGRVIVYSGYFSGAHEAELLALNVNHLLPKPFTRVQLVELFK